MTSRKNFPQLNFFFKAILRQVGGAETWSGRDLHPLSVTNHRQEGFHSLRGPPEE